jgi:hypothetical protein
MSDKYEAELEKCAAVLQRLHPIGEVKGIGLLECEAALLSLEKILPSRQDLDAIAVVEQLQSWANKSFTGEVTPYVSATITTTTTSISIGSIEVWNSEYQIDGDEEENELSFDACLRTYRQEIAILAAGAGRLAETV